MHGFKKKAEDRVICHWGSQISLVCPGHCKKVRTHCVMDEIQRQSHIVYCLGPLELNTAILNRLTRLYYC